jgi:hypothetical protein
MVGRAQQIARRRRRAASPQRRTERERFLQRTVRPGGQTTMKLTGGLTGTSNCWTVVPGGAVNISVVPKSQTAGAPMVPWVVNNANNIFWRQSGEVATTGWGALPGTAQDIAAGDGVAWSIGTMSSPGGFRADERRSRPSDRGGAGGRRSGVRLRRSRPGARGPGGRHRLRRG